MVIDKESNKWQKGKLGLWRKEARRNSKKNLERDFTVGNHQFVKLELRVRLTFFNHKYIISEKGLIMLLLNF